MRSLVKELLFEKRTMGFKIDLDKDWDDITPEEAGLEQEIGKDKQGGTHAFHGWSMPRAAMKDDPVKSGPQFQTAQEVVTEDELRHAVNYLLKYRPEELYVYSRGSAVWANVQELAPEVADLIGTVNYMAPAKLRTNWGAADIDLKNKPGKVYAAPQDGKIPLKQAATIAQDIGQSNITLVDVEPRGVDMSNPSDFGRKGHTTMRARKYFKDTKEIPVSDVLSSDLPDWGDASADGEQLKDQMKFAKEKGLAVSGLQEIRKFVRKIILEAYR